MLENNRASLEQQTVTTWSQSLLVDDIGRGVPWANKNLSRHEAAADYVWVLDDDDECIHPSLFDELTAIVDRCEPDVIMLRMDHGLLGILPTDELWGERPRHGYVGSSAFVVSRETWNDHAHAWDTGLLGGDFSFINEVFHNNPNVYWHDVVASKVQRISWGERE